MQKVLENGNITSELIYQFNLEKGFGKKEFLSFLYYLGNLTIEGSLQMGLSRFRIPNQVIAELYWQYYATVLQSYAGIETEEYDLHKVVHNTATDSKYEL